MSLGHCADTRTERDPERGDHVVIQPMLDAIPNPERLRWTAVWVRWESVKRAHFVVDTIATNGEGSTRHHIKAECLVGLA